jgi:hypothetical protein
VRVDKLIEILRRYPTDLEIELAVVAPPEGDDLEIDRYSVEGVLEWEDEEGTSCVWLVGGEAENVDAFLDTIEDEE